ncbi:MAG: phosphotransferase [Anaerolineales bacterium]
MPNDVLADLKGIDPACLTDVVRQDQRNDSFEISAWSVRRLSEQGMANPNGLWRFSGTGHAGGAERPWSVVLKILTRPKEEQPAHDLWYWKRELLVAESGLTERLPGPVKAPRFYRCPSQPETWLWMEHIHDTQPGLWPLENFRFAARELGRWNGAMVLAGPPPADPWLGRRHYRTWLQWLDPERHWQFPLLQKHASAELRARWDQLWAEREEFFWVLETLPLVFCHADTQRRNLAIRPGRDQANELVVLDWGLCGLAPLGVEMAMCVFGNLALIEWRPSAASALDATVFDAYIAGLHAAGWLGEVGPVRLAFTAWIAVFLGLVYPAAMHDFCGPEARDSCLRNFRMAEEELFLEYLSGMVYALDRAEEARALIRHLKV